MLTDKQRLWEGYVVPSFSDLMVKQLAAHSKKGHSWTNDKPDSLLERAKEELKEVDNALNKLNTSVGEENYKKRFRHLAKECADVANFMMMIVDSTK